MNKLGLIIQREYLQMVAKKSFIVTTILVPILSILLCGVLPIMLSNVKSDEKKVVAVVDQTEGEQFQSLFTATDEYQFVTCDHSLASSSSDESYYDYYKQNEGLYAIVILPQDIVTTQQLTILSEQSLSGSLESDIRSILYHPIRSLKIAAHDIEGLEEILQDCDVNLDVRTIKWGEDGKETVSSAMVSEIVGLCLAFLTYMFVLTYGAMIMSGVVEEKTNRIVEVIISSCKPIELMLGKIIGVALVGLTQFAVWGVLLGTAGLIATVAFGLNAPLDPSVVDPSALDPSITPNSSLPHAHLERELPPHPHLLPALFRRRLPALCQPLCRLWFGRRSAAGYFAVHGSDHVLHGFRFVCGYVQHAES